MKSTRASHGSGKKGMGKTLPDLKGRDDGNTDAVLATSIRAFQWLLHPYYETYTITCLQTYLQHAYKGTKVHRK